MMRFPKAAERVPLTVAFDPENGGEHWTRDFGGTRFSSHQSRGAGRNEHLLVERFGALSFAMALVVEQDRLHLIPRRWSAFGIRSEEQTSELQSLMRISYAVFFLKKKK